MSIIISDPGDEVKNGYITDSFLSYMIDKKKPLSNPIKELERAILQPTTKIGEIIKNKNHDNT